MKFPIPKELTKTLDGLLTDIPIDVGIIMQYAMAGVMHISDYEDGKRYLGLVNGHVHRVFMWDARTQRFHGYLYSSRSRERINPTVCCSPYNDDGSDMFLPLMKLPEDRQFRGRNAYRQKQYSLVRF